MRISTAGKHIEVIRIKNNIFHIINHADKGLKGTAVNQALPVRMEGYLKLHLDSLICSVLFILFWFCKIRV